MTHEDMAQQDHRIAAQLAMKARVEVTVARTRARDAVIAEAKNIVENANHQAHSRDVTVPKHFVDELEALLDDLATIEREGW